MASVVKLGSGKVGTRPLAIPNLLMDGDRGTAAKLAASITEAVLEQTMEGAGSLTLTVHDPARELLQSRLVRKRSTVTLNGVQYRLVSVARDAGQLTLTLEPTAVNVLRDMRGAKKANRKTVSRARFAEMLLQEPRGFEIPYEIPEVKVRQPIAPQPQTADKPPSALNG